MCSSQINEIWCYPASGGNAPSACPLLHFTDRPITRIVRNTIVPIPSSQTARSAGPLWSEQRKGLTRIEAPPLDLGGVLPMTPDLVCSPDRMLQGFYVSSCPPQSHLLLPSTSFALRAFVIRQNPIQSYHSHPTNKHQISTCRLSLLPPHFYNSNTVVLLSISNQSLQLLA